MTRKSVLKAVAALAGAVIVAWVVHILGLVSKEPSCFARGEFWGPRRRTTFKLVFVIQ
jgi:hypothetical protein